MDHDEIMRRRKKVLTTSMSTPEVQKLLAIHRGVAPRNAEDDAGATVEWLTYKEAAARVAVGARMLCGDDRASPGFDPCLHSWADFVGTLRDDAGREWDENDRRRLDHLRRSVLEDGLRRTSQQYFRGLSSGERLVPLTDGVAITFTHYAWASFMAAAWTSGGESSRYGDWHGDIRFEEPVAVRGVGISVAEINMGLHVFVLQCDEAPGEGRIFLNRRPYGLNRTPAEMCIIEYLADTPISAAVAAQEWHTVVQLALDAWRESHGSKAGDAASAVVLDGGRASA